MSAKPVQCPNCGKPGAGRFCSECGAAIVCASCGNRASRGAKACEVCGASLTVAPRQGSAQLLAPWVALGVASVALVLAMVSLMNRGDRAPLAGFPPSPSPLSTAPRGPGQPPDLSTMTPRQAADRLFNRIMTAAEGGNTQEVMRFAPMALQAYGALGTLDNDARYHVALIHMSSGNIEGTRAQLESLHQSVPNHLLGIMLEYDIAERSGNQDAAAQAYKKFLAAYEAEITAARPEYLDHASGIERFRKAAEARMAGKK